MAAFGERDVERLLADPDHPEPRQDEAAIVNARAALELPGGLSALVWKYAEPVSRAPASLADVPSQTPASRALAKELKRHGFRFVGPTTVYALMQAIGIVNDHVAGCWVREEVNALRSAAFPC